MWPFLPMGGLSRVQVSTMPSNSGKARLASESTSFLHRFTCIRVRADLIHTERAADTSHLDFWPTFEGTLQRSTEWHGPPIRACSSRPVRTLLSRYVTPYTFTVPFEAVQIMADTFRTALGSQDVQDPYRPPGTHGRSVLRRLCGRQGRQWRTRQDCQDVSPGASKGGRGSWLTD